jgi:hypothetical protein
MARANRHGCCPVKESDLKYGYQDRLPRELRKRVSAEPGSPPSTKITFVLFLINL